MGYYSVIKRTEGRGEWGLTDNGYSIFEGNQNILKLDRVMVAQLCECAKKKKNHRIVYLNRIKYVVYELYLNFFNFFFNEEEYMKIFSHKNC